MSGDGGEDGIYKLAKIYLLNQSLKTRELRFVTPLCNTQLGCLRTNIGSLQHHLSGTTRKAISVLMMFASQQETVAGAGQIHCRVQFALTTHAVLGYEKKNFGQGQIIACSSRKFFGPSSHHISSKCCPSPCGLPCLRPSINSWATWRQSWCRQEIELLGLQGHSGIRRSRACPRSKRPESSLARPRAWCCELPNRRS